MRERRAGLSESLLNPTWQMSNLQEMGSEDKTGKANRGIFLCVVTVKGSDVILFFFFHVMSMKKPKRTGSTKWRETWFSVVRSTVGCIRITFGWCFYKNFLFLTDHSGPGPGWTGEEAAVGLQGGAAHLCHVPRELKATPRLTQRENERDGTTISTGPSEKVLHYLPLIVGARTMNQTWDLCVSTAEQTYSCFSL